ncbi:MAG: hypothetical protein WAO91_10465 [Candidatus Nitrosotenuis sp.]
MSIENKLLACFKVVGLDPKMDSFNDRKKMQKMVNLMQEAGVQFPFNFTWYFRGPYSSSLADSLFAIVRNNITDEERLSEEEVTKIQNIKNFLGDKINSADYLELLASLLFLKRRSTQVNVTEEDIIEFIKENKPYFSEKEIRNCLKDVERFEEQFLISSNQS